MYMVCFEHAIQMSLILFLMSRFVPCIPCMVFTCIDECVHMCVHNKNMFGILLFGPSLKHAFDEQLNMNDFMRRDEASVFCTIQLLLA